MNKEQKTLKSCYILDRLREWFELYGNQNHQRAEEELHLAIDELYEYQQKDQQLADLEAKLAEKEKEIDNLYDRLNSKQKFYEMSLEKDYKEYLSRLDKLEKQCDKDKISFTIQQLEKVKELLLEKCGETYSKTYCGIDEDIEEIIDNRIKQLKEGK